MVVDQLSKQAADRVFRALADSTRRDIVTRIAAGPQSVSALADHYPMSFAAVQKHVAVLERAALVRKERHGRERRVGIVPETLRSAGDLLRGYEQLWRHRVAAMEAVLAAEPDTAAGTDVADRRQ